jgi:hypothetical protein
VPLQLDEQPTNGITYASVLLDASTLPDRLVPYMDLFADYLTELGTAQRDYKAGASTRPLCVIIFVSFFASSLFSAQPEPLPSLTD